MARLGEHAACPWPVRVFADLLRLLPQNDRASTATPNEVDRELAARTAAVRTLLLPALARGWYVHGWYADMVSVSVIGSPNLRVSAVVVALMFTSGVSPHMFVKHHLPGDVIWELALLCGAEPDGRCFSNLNHQPPWVVAQSHYSTAVRLGGYAWPLWPMFYHVPSRGDIFNTRARQWPFLGYDIFETAWPISPRSAWAFA
jgi:hypothetical protein